MQRHPYTAEKSLTMLDGVKVHDPVRSQSTMELAGCVFPSHERRQWSAMKQQWRERAGPPLWPAAAPQGNTHIKLSMVAPAYDAMTTRKVHDISGAIEREGVVGSGGIKVPRHDGDSAGAFGRPYGEYGARVRAGFGVGSARMNVMIPVSDARATAT